MKKVMKVIIPAFLLATPLASMAQPGGYGMCNYGSQTVSNVTCYGAASLQGTTVTGTVKVYGPLTMNGATVNDVIVRGEMTSTSSSVNGSTQIDGPLYASGTKFNHSINAATDLVQLSGSSVNGNVTEKSTGGAPVLKLMSGSNVSGDVDFTGESGVVKLDQSSNVGGSIENGKKQPLS